MTEQPRRGSHPVAFGQKQPSECVYETGGDSSLG
jgi:hypothetical protein